MSRTENDFSHLCAKYTLYLHLWRALSLAARVQKSTRKMKRATNSNGCTKNNCASMVPSGSANSFIRLHDTCQFVFIIWGRMKNKHFGVSQFSDNKTASICISKMPLQNLVSHARRNRLPRLIFARIMIWYSIQCSTAAIKSQCKCGAHNRSRFFFLLISTIAFI